MTAVPDKSIVSNHKKLQNVSKKWFRPSLKTASNMFGSLLLLALVFGPSLCNGQLMISTFAGGGTTLGDGGPATAAKLLSPSGICSDRYGNIYVSDQNDCRVRKIDTAGIITTVAGRGYSGSDSTHYSGDGGPADSARLWYPEGVAVDTFGNLYIADQNNNAIRMVAGGNIYTLAGNGTIGDSGDGGPATAATLWHPADVTVDRYGNVFFVDQDNKKLKRIDTLGLITTICGTGVAGYNGDSIAADTAQLNFPEGIGTDTAGNLYVADFYNGRVRKIDMATGMIYSLVGSGTCVSPSSGDGGPATAAGMCDAAAVGSDQFGNIYVTDFYNFKIRKVDPSGIITTIAGNDTSGFSGDCGPATAAELSYAQGVNADPAGNVYIADFSNSRVRKVSVHATCPPADVLPVAEYPETARIYPNPARDVVAVTRRGMFHVEVSNLMGAQVLASEECNNAAEIDISKLVPGIYLMTINGGGQTDIRKLVVEH